MAKKEKKPALAFFTLGTLTSRHYYIYLIFQNISGEKVN